MFPVARSSVSQKKAYQRPYKSRQERREVDRRKYDESRDHRFLLRAGAVVGLLLLLTLGFALKGLLDKDSLAPPPALEARR